MTGSQLTYREGLSKHIDSLREVNKRKRACQDILKGLGEQLDAVESEKNQLQKSLVQNCKTAEQVTDEIKNLEYKHKMGSFKSSTDENKLIKQMEQLKASMPKATRFSELKPLATDLIGKKQKAWGDLKEIRKEVEVKEVEIEKVRKEMEHIKEGQTGVREQVTELTGEADALQVTIQSLFKQKDEERETYYKGKYDYEVQRDEIFHIQ